MWGSPAYVKILVGDKLDSRSSLCRSSRESRPPERYGFIGLTSQLDYDSRTYGEAMSNIDPDKWLEGLDGFESTFKARLVARRYTQRSGVDFEDASSNGQVHSDTACHSNMCIRPNVTYTLSVTSRYQACTEEAHWSAVILKYLKTTKDMFLIYGFVFQLNDGVVAWKSSKQATTTDSTTEAEYIAASEAAKEAFWIKNYIQELGVVPSIAEPVVIFCDNNGAIAQAMESRSHHRSKHILRRYHLLRETVSRGDIRMNRVSSLENIADPLTNLMSQIAHTQHLDKMGLRSMGDWL
ncbi:UNVERIFIED_CONTAM: Retrovirus-related Pol polyprotein from transposon TNT 1-94 [Sesamum latifolium]|uniref:Retrovirus-related Pol polyprotein from transposon TNT 1-94 n=1 Tax=Sesamum latifolium TaxID=2727402 RepID=A0AAW2TMI6_9LAMI